MNIDQYFQLNDCEEVLSEYRHLFFAWSKDSVSGRNVACGLIIRFASDLDLHISGMRKV